MKLSKCIVLGLAVAGLQGSVYAETRIDYAVGEDVLVNCRSIHTRGTVKTKVDQGYIVQFPKNSGPLQCGPYRWDHQFVSHFKSVAEYPLQFKESGMLGKSRDLLFKVGETVTLRLDRDKRVLGTKEPIDIEAEIVDISDVGAVALRLLSSDRHAGVTFNQWIGTNYIDLRHDAFKPERAKRANY